MLPAECISGFVCRGQIIPMSLATRQASMELPTCSFLNMSCLCRLTVLILIESRAAMSLLIMPLAMSLITCTSLSDSNFGTLPLSIGLVSPVAEFIISPLAGRLTTEGV